MILREQWSSEYESFAQTTILSQHMIHLLRAGNSYWGQARYITHMA